MPADTPAEACPRCRRTECAERAASADTLVPGLPRHEWDRRCLVHSVASLDCKLTAERSAREAAAADRDAWANATYSETPAELSKAFADAATEHVRLSGELAAERSAREAAERECERLRGLVSDLCDAATRGCRDFHCDAAARTRLVLDAAKETP